MVHKFAQQSAEWLLFYIIPFSTASDRKSGGMQSTDDFKGKSGYRMHVFAVYGYVAFKNQKASFVFLLLIWE